MVVLTTLAILLVVATAAALIWRNGAIWTPLPVSMVDWLFGILRGSWSLTAYRFLLVLAFFGSAYALIVGFGMIGSFIAALILTTLAAERVRTWILDIWNANFYWVGVS
jgi:hypothetical protein